MRGLRRHIRGSLVSSLVRRVCETEGVHGKEAGKGAADKRKDALGLACSLWGTRRERVFIT